MGTVLTGVAFALLHGVNIPTTSIASYRPGLQKLNIVEYFCYTDMRDGMWVNNRVVNV